MEIKQLSKVQGPMVPAHSIYRYLHYDWSHVSICFNILDIFDVFDIVKHFKFVFQRDRSIHFTRSPAASYKDEKEKQRQAQDRAKMLWSFPQSQKSGPILLSCQKTHREVGRESAC